MPRGDGTGPGGRGPMTGRAAGFCAGYQVPGYANPVGGRGYGAGFGRGGGFCRGAGRGGRGFRGSYGAVPWQAGYGYGAVAPVVPYTPTGAQEAEALRNRSTYLEEELAALRQRLEDLDTKKEK